MRNITTEVKGTKIIFTVDVSEKMVKEAPLSSSGKNKLVASSGGNQQVAVNGHDVKFGLNVFVK